ncbi:XdhC family protein [Fusibacter sp. JL216-2]|uniref:XdhC family protein n=1 Tax=Fusibacter sp. JL216-2 TaxID=3071453 RepID=UPI003D340497
MNIFSTADKWQGQGYGFIMATIIESKGSTPRHNAKMLVREDGQLSGTIGGGPAEYKVIQDGLKALKMESNSIQEYIFDKNVEGGLPTHCGGAMKVLIEVFPKKKRIVLIGAGHVNQAVMKIANQLNWSIVVADDRPEYATKDLLDRANDIYTDKSIEKAVECVGVTDEDICVIATKDCDLEALREALKYRPRHLGMIGSKRKVKKIFETLMDEGVSQDILNEVHAPVGLDIGAETPMEIGVSIMSEIIAFLNNKTGTCMKDWVNDQ